MGRLEELEKQHQRSAARAGIGDTPPPAARRTGGSPLKWILPLLLLLLIGGGAAWWWMNAGGSEAAKLAKVADQKREAVGLVVAIATDAQGRQIMRPFATAWALEPDLYITNAHVADTARRLAADGARIAVMVNQRPDLVFPVRSLRMHPLYGATRAATTASGEVGFAYDVAAFRVEGRAPATFAVAPAARLEALAAGSPVAYLGFPMENLVGGGVSLHNPVAVMQTGILTAVSDFRQETNLPRNHLLLRHNLGLTGGASGSPLFDTSGRVVGILNAGNMAGQVLGLSDDRQLIMGRTPSAVMINFAQRADLIDGLGPETALVPGDRAAPTYTVADFTHSLEILDLTDFTTLNPFHQETAVSAPPADGAMIDLTPSPLALIDVAADVEGLRPRIVREHENGEPAIIQYFRGDELVRQRHFHDNGQLAIDRPVQNGKAHGLERRFYRTGRKSRETEYAAGQKHGSETFFHIDTGTVNRVTLWQRNRIQEPSTFFNRDGSLMQGSVDFFFHNETETGLTQTLAISRHLVNGRMHGPHVFYHRNGNKSWEGTFADGWREGVFEFWHAEGYRQSRITYRRGQQTHPIERFTPSGFLRQITLASDSARGSGIRTGSFTLLEDISHLSSIRVSWRDGSNTPLSTWNARYSDSGKPIAYTGTHLFDRPFFKVGWNEHGKLFHKTAPDQEWLVGPPPGWADLEPAIRRAKEQWFPNWQATLRERHILHARLVEHLQNGGTLSESTIEALNAADIRLIEGDTAGAREGYRRVLAAMR